MKKEDTCGSSFFTAAQSDSCGSKARPRRAAASVDLKVVGKLLTVKGNVKAVAVRFFGLYGQVRKQLFSGCALGGHLRTLVEGDRLFGKVPHEIEDQLPMKGTAVFAGVQNV